MGQQATKPDHTTPSCDSESFFIRRKYLRVRDDRFYFRSEFFLPISPAMMLPIITATSLPWVRVNTSPVKLPIFKQDNNPSKLTAFTSNLLVFRFYSWFLYNLQGIILSRTVSLKIFLNYSAYYSTITQRGVMLFNEIFSQRVTTIFTLACCVHSDQVCKHNLSGFVFDINTATTIIHLLWGCWGWQQDMILFYVNYPS